MTSEARYLYQNTDSVIRGYESEASMKLHGERKCLTGKWMNFKEERDIWIELEGHLVPLLWASPFIWIGGSSDIVKPVN